MWILISMIILFALGIPIAFTLGIVGLIAVLVAGVINPQIVPLTIFNGFQSYTLIAIPLFILMGQIMTQSSIATRLIDFATSLVGFIKGGLGMATVTTGMAMAAISGSSVADAAALGSTLIPQMVKKGYSKGFAVAIVSSSATIAMIIPPSIAMILYSVIAGVSISEVFIAGIIPGVMVGVSLMIVIYLFAMKYKLPVDSNFSLKKVGATLKKAILGLFLPIIIIGGIIGGFFTPTEAAGIGVTYSLVLCLIYKELSLKGLIKALSSTVQQTSVVLLLVGTSSVLGWYMAQQQIPQKIAEGILDFSTNQYIVLLLASGLLILGGVIIHGTPLIIMAVPILVPLVESVGIDLIQFGIVVCISIAIGQITPPVASVLMVTTSIANISIDQALKSLMPMFFAILIVLILVTFIPALSLWLPSLFY